MLVTQLNGVYMKSLIIISTFAILSSSVFAQGTVPEAVTSGRVLSEVEKACLDNIVLTHSSPIFYMSGKDRSVYTSKYALLNLNAHYKLGIPQERAFELSQAGAIGFLKINSNSVTFELQTKCLEKKSDCFDFQTRPLTQEIISKFISVSIQDIEYRLRRGFFVFRLQQLVNACRGLDGVTNSYLNTIQRRL